MTWLDTEDPMEAARILDWFRLSGKIWCRDNCPSEKDDYLQETTTTGMALFLSSKIAKEGN